MIAESSLCPRSAAESVDAIEVVSRHILRSDWETATRACTVSSWDQCQWISSACLEHFAVLLQWPVDRSTTSNAPRLFH